MSGPSELFLPDFEAALTLAGLRHDGQRRRDTGAPYLVHLVHVAQILAQAGYDLRTQIVGLLHDLLEDTCEGPAELAARAAEIEAGFGPEVREAVEWLSEPKFDPDGRHQPWKTRKLAYLSQLAEAPALALPVAAADKLHNLATLVFQLQRDGGEQVWALFTGAPDQQLWFYTQATQTLAQRLDGPLIPALRAQLAELRPWVQRAPPRSS